MAHRRNPQKKSEPPRLDGLSDRRVDLCGQRYLSGTIEVDGEHSYRAMVHSELPISVLFMTRAGRIYSP
jgi:hypothetical protein